MKTQSVWTPRPLPGLVSASSPLARSWPRTGPLAQRWARACALALSPGRSGPPCGPRHTAAAPERTTGVRPRPPRGRQDRCCVSRALCDRWGSVRGPLVASRGAQRSGDVGVLCHLLSACVSFLELPLILTASFKQFTSRAPPPRRSARERSEPGARSRHASCTHASLPCGSSHCAWCGRLASPRPPGDRALVMALWLRGLRELVTDSLPAPSE